MSSPRSPARSNASSSPSTPLALGLSPRSRLRALLARADSTDEEGDGQTRKTTNFASKHGDSASDTSDEDTVVRPRGRLAARMQATISNLDQPALMATNESDSEPAKDARERVKQLLQKKTVPRSLSADTEEIMEDGYDDVIISHPRKLKNRARHSTTPDNTSIQRQGSPRMLVTPHKTSNNMNNGDMSPGLFVTPHREGDGTASPRDQESQSDEELPSHLLKSNRFKELIAKKRAERLAKEAEDERKMAAIHAARVAEAAQNDFVDDEDDSNISDDEGGRKLTQEGRPAARKASRKAMEEMNRETQRMSRNLQLAHEAKTKKKITKASLFERFNFRPQGAPTPEKPANSSHPTTPASAHTDAEMRDTETPPSSPPALAKNGTPAKQAMAELLENAVREDGEELPCQDAIITSTAAVQGDAGKGKAVAAEIVRADGPNPSLRRQVRVKLPIHANLMLNESDDELVVAPIKKTKLDAIFDRVPAQKEKESRPMVALRRLAQLRSPGKEGNRKDAKESITPAELQLSLVQRARQQAKIERDRRLDLLKSKGIHIQTEAERQQEMADVEDIVARARKEAEEIMQRERDLAKEERKAKKESGEVDPLAWDDSDSDNEYEEEVEPEELELSGSEESDDDDDAEEGSNEGHLIDDAASSAGESQDDEEDTPEDGFIAESDEEMKNVPSRFARRAKKKVTIISDDEEDEEDVLVAKTPKAKPAFPKSPSVQQNSGSPQIPTSVLRSATKTFIPGLPVANGAPAGLGLTQIFAGTMDDSQTGLDETLQSAPRPTFDFAPQSMLSQVPTAESDDMILDSQPGQPEEETQAMELHMSQSQVHNLDSLIRMQEYSQVSEMLEPSQDAGYGNYTPLKERFVEAPPSTIDTVLIESTQPGLSQTESPAVQRRSRLRQRIDATAESEEEGETPADEARQGSENSTTAFSVMRDAAAKEERRNAREAFDKKKSKAKEMIEEQAEESEDEYAGLGGADGEDSDNDSAASVHEMIDNDYKTSTADDAKLAAFVAYVTCALVYF
jgi:mediator of replication checkpoint protein 1